MPFFPFLIFTVLSLQQASYHLKAKIPLLYVHIYLPSEGKSLAVFRFST